MLDLNKHIVTDDNQHFHSSGIARSANNNRIGSVSVVSFEKRQQMEQNRQKIQSYHRSAVGNVRSVAKVNSTNNIINKESNPTQNNNSIVKPRRFNDTPPRGYNPFS